jgi:FkbM family methyltransferase
VHDCTGASPGSGWAWELLRRSPAIPSVYNFFRVSIRAMPKDINQTVVESIAHIIREHPELAPVIASLAMETTGASLSDLNFLRTLNAQLLADSKAQLRQDIFVLSELSFKRGGYFVEFGATNGLDLSNTWLLEKKFGWTGILAEPAKLWHESLRANRQAKIDTRCVWKRSGETLSFIETQAPELSTIQEFSAADGHAKSREMGLPYSVETVSLLDLLQQHEAPQDIEYLSIDTEGSEFDILHGFDFERYRIKVITCEHNYTPIRERIHALLSAHGYARKYESVSQWDDWFVRQS